MEAGGNKTVLLLETAGSVLPAASPVQYYLPLEGGTPALAGGWGTPLLGGGGPVLASGTPVLAGGSPVLGYPLGMDLGSVTGYHLEPVTGVPLERTWDQ